MNFVEFIFYTGQSSYGFQCYDGTWLPVHAFCDGQRDCAGKNWEDEHQLCGIVTPVLLMSILLFELPLFTIVNSIIIYTTTKASSYLPYSAFSICTWLCLHSCDKLLLCAGISCKHQGNLDNDMLLCYNKLITCNSASVFSVFNSYYQINMKSKNITELNI